MSAEATSVTGAVPATLRARFDAIAALYPSDMRRSLVLPLLHCLQEDRGYVTEADAVMIADYIGMPAVEAVEAWSWYSMFEHEPQGHYVLKVCRNIACTLRGAEELLAHLEQRLGIRAGETTADGRFTLKTVECLASCGTAPAMQVNGRYHESLDAAAADRILGALE